MTIETKNASEMSYNINIASLNVEIRQSNGRTYFYGDNSENLKTQTTRAKRGTGRVTKTVGNPWKRISKAAAIETLAKYGVTVEQLIAYQNGELEIVQITEPETDVEAEQAAATNEAETTMTKPDKIAAIEAEIKSVIAERTDAYDELEAAEANDEISQETIDRINEDIEDLSNQYWKLVDELEAAKAEPDIVTYRDGKLDWVSSPKYGASFNPSTGQYVVRHFECGKTSGKVVHTDYTSDPEKFFAKMEKRGACSFNEPAKMTDATFEQLLDSRKPIDVIIKQDPQTREEYYAVEGQRLSEEQFAAAMIHDEYVEILNTVEFYREHHGLTLAQAEQIYIYNLDEDNIVDGHVDQMIAQFKAENNSDPDDAEQTKTG